MAKTSLRRVEEDDVGRFNNGDVYLVMHAAQGDSAEEGGNHITRTLFYWVGSKASMDKGTVACIKAVELRRAMPGPCSIRREDEGQESPEFLVMFDEVTVADDESGERVLSKVSRSAGLAPPCPTEVCLYVWVAPPAAARCWLSLLSYDIGWDCRAQCVV